MNSNYSYDEWYNEDLSDDEISEKLIEDILLQLDNFNYDGHNDYNAMYWFVKGSKMPPPRQPKRYIDSDEYLFKNLNQRKRFDPLNEFKRQRLQGKFKRDLHKKDSSFLEHIKKQADDLHEFWKTDRLHHPLNAEAIDDDVYIDPEPKELNKMTLDSFKEWQRKEILKLMQQKQLEIFKTNLEIAGQPDPNALKALSDQYSSQLEQQANNLALLQ